MHLRWAQFALSFLLVKVAVWFQPTLTAPRRKANQSWTDRTLPGARRLRTSEPAGASLSAFIVTAFETCDEITESL